MSSYGTDLLCSIIQAKNGIDQFMDMNLLAEFFKPGHEETLYQYMENHFIKHGTLPKLQTIKKDLGVDYFAPLEPPSYYLDHVQKRHTHQVLKEAVIQSNELLNAKEPQKAYDLFVDVVLKLNLTAHRRDIVDFKEKAYDIVEVHLKKKKLEDPMAGVKFGWPYLDAMSGPLNPGDVVTIIGRTGRGKTFAMLYAAHYNWKYQHKSPMIISMEMNPIDLVQRISAIHTHVPAKRLRLGALSTKNHIKLAKELMEVKNSEGDYPPFWVIDGNLTATIEEIALLVQQLKPDVVFIDGAYLLETRSHHKSDWGKVKETCQGIKKNIAANLRVPVIASYQFNREMTKLKKEEDTGTEHVAGSDAVGQLSTIMLGLFDKDNVETKTKRRIRVLKGRNGEVGEFMINWIFDNYPFMNFSEIVKKKDADGNELPPEKLNYI